MTDIDIIVKILIGIYSDGSIRDSEKIFNIINSIEGIDRVSILKELIKIGKQEHNFSLYFSNIVRYLPVTGSDFVQLKDNFDELFVVDNRHDCKRVTAMAFQFDTFSKEEMDIFLEKVSMKDDNGRNMYDFYYYNQFIKFMSLEQYKRYYHLLKIHPDHAYQEFPHHTRETVLDILKDNKHFQAKDIIWAVNTCLLNELDLRPYIPLIAKANGCFTKEVKKRYSKEFWMDVFMAMAD